MIPPEYFPEFIPDYGEPVLPGYAAKTPTHRPHSAYTIHLRSVQAFPNANS
jgi:hypothetical protein